MSNFDYLDLNGRTLRLFLTVIEEGSVTAAAERLNLTQSAVSHSLEKLREITGEALFVRSGRGIAATAHALALADRARKILDGMKTFTTGADFHPTGSHLRLVIAANDLQRDLMLPPFLRQLEDAGAEVSLRVVPSGMPGADLLRHDRCDLVITPRPPAGLDIMQKRLLTDRYVCFYDAQMRPPPETLADYLHARHVTVVHDNDHGLEFDQMLTERGIRRDVAITVPNFAGVPPFLRGSPRLATLPSLLASGIMQGFAMAPMPMEDYELPFFMVWHGRNQHDPRHSWLREQLEQAARTLS
ncbi:LysR family transcriptional regulator [Telmatospirillum sp. J64-1]|uniref:LysR family transcriptional regulator n=1 Tax=Telmatospirillum sp. J64-1 TaxID=2502183 RepID=UPI00115E237B|nr:LysR family transcriptional regulator [Telmatospirillum sp. J64-1]